MVIDTSALIAVLQREPEAPALESVMEKTPIRRLSAATLVETGIVLQARYGDHGEREIDLLVQRARIDVIPVTIEQADLARSAYRRFGKGRHPAGLNFGDCFAYALSVALDEPLLFVGEDFARTDALVMPY